jgi:uncharacterized protein (DUF1697 family)
MQAYIAFLRGINVGGRNKISMVELRQSLERVGFKNVRTYLQSGNVMLESELSSTDAITTSIGKTILATFGFDIPILVLTKPQLERIIVKTPYASEEQINTNTSYFVLLFERPKKELHKAFQVLTYVNEQFQLSETCVYLLCLNGYGKAKLNNNLVEAKLKVVATARNYRTMQNVLALVN